MADVSSLAGDIAGAGAALAGLTLVFMGHTGAAYYSHSTTDRQAVRKTYQRRSRLAFVGFALSLAATLSSLIGKWQDNGYLVFSGGIALGVALLVVLVAAWETVRGIS
jgi:hypothetical protein